MLDVWGCCSEGENLEVLRHLWFYYFIGNKKQKKISGILQYFGPHSKLSLGSNPIKEKSWNLSKPCLTLFA